MSNRVSSEKGSLKNNINRFKKTARLIVNISNLKSSTSSILDERFNNREELMEVVSRFELIF
jgi:hypothetical protein